MPDAEEVEYGLLVFLWSPAEGLYVALPVYVALLAGLHVVDAQTVQVCLIAIACHRLPCNLGAVRRELGILVVAWVGSLCVAVDALVSLSVAGVALRGDIALRLTEVLRRFGLYIIKVDV